MELEIEFLGKPVEASIRGISVLDDQIVWLSGSKGSIIKTRDGGKNWKVLNQPDMDSLDYRDIHAFSDSVALVMSAGFPSRIYRTTNGGADWNLVHENSDSSAFMNSIVFSDQSTGVAFGDQLGSSHLFLRTVDAGKSWSRIDSNALPNPLEVENGFAASGTCVAVNKEGSFVVCLGGEMVRSFYSKDGSNWSAYNTPMFSGKNSRGVYSLAFGKDRFIAVGGDYLEVDSARYPIYSIDGKNWAKLDSKTNGYRSVIDYSEALDMWLSAGTNGVDYSPNEGNSWTKVADLNLNTLQFVPQANIAFAANHKGEIYIMRFILD